MAMMVIDGGGSSGAGHTPEAPTGGPAVPVGQGHGLVRGPDPAGSSADHRVDRGAGRGAGPGDRDGGDRSGSGRASRVGRASALGLGIGVASGVLAALGIATVVAAAAVIDESSAVLEAAGFLVLIGGYGGAIGAVVGGVVGAVSGTLLGLFGREHWAPTASAIASALVYAWLPLLTAVQDDDPAALALLLGVVPFAVLGYVAGRIFAGTMAETDRRPRRDGMPGPAGWGGAEQPPVTWSSQ